MQRLILTTCFILIVLTGFSQKVGLVLSGGAAKGIAHVGVLKALEENEIPIDYVVGTSMGGIIGGCYAAGMSPHQIEEIVLSREFLRWINGNFEVGNKSYYSRNDDDASFLRLNLSLDSALSILFNTNIANDLSLNFALAEKLAQPSAIAGDNFDSLFIPLRVVASDIFTQTEVILSRGALSDALRATQTVPFFYTPIRIDGKYLFDGGVYNNFPVDVVEKEFNPDVVIGSNVSSKIYLEYPYKEDDKLISKSLLYMLLDKSDPSDIPESGIYIQPNLGGYTTFDFGKAQALIDSGYVQTMRQIHEIKNKIASRRTCEEVAVARNKFNNKTPAFVIEKIEFDGFNINQQKYINRFFKVGNRNLTFSEVKFGFYNLTSEAYFSNLYPTFTFNPDKQDFNFKLTKRPQNNFQVDFGGVIATRNISSIYLGLNYYYFNRALTHANINFTAGNFYKSVQMKARIDIPNRIRYYLEPYATFNTWDYFQGKDLVLKNIQPTVLNRIDRKIGLSWGFPIRGNYKLTLDGSYINNRDQYINSRVLVSTDTLDILRLRGSRLGINFSTNTLNRKQYASTGKLYSFSADWFGVNEILEPGNTSIAVDATKSYRTWVRAKISLEQYFKRGIYSSGYFLEGVFSNQPVFTNYGGTIINAPAFYPMQDSKTLLLENFRAFNFVAGGWRNVFAIRKSLDFRIEGYLFKPIESIGMGQNQEAALSREITDLFFAGTAGFVLHSTVGPISLSINYYDDKQNELGVLLHVGFLLFNKASMD
ncbi:MAG: patatin-like phospholipase family protein [Cyclobacteriaceae bacterium]|nr:patatin-like phospholipase family protein [Cyclobacteriaceae bacterium]